MTGEKIVVKPTIKNEMKNPERVVFELAAYRQPNPIIVKIKVIQ
jgi:hypothetical protein